MRKSTVNVFLIFFVIYAPLFGQLFLRFRENSKTFSYGFVLIFLYAFFFRFLKHRLDLKQYWVMAFLCLTFIAIGVFHLVFGVDRVTDFLYINYSYVLSLFLLAYLSTFKNSDRQMLLEKLFTLIVIAFLVQLGISAYESSLGYYISAQSEWLNSGTYSVTLSDRFLLNAISPNIGKLMFGNIFYHPFSGLIGQHNYWGTQLPFYNLIFLLMYLQKREWKYLALLFMVFAAILLNTSRFGVFSIFFTDFWIALNTVRFSGYKGAIIVAVSGFFLSLFVVLSPVLLEGSAQYLQHQNTLAYRFARYPALASTFTLSNTSGIFLGNSVNEVSELIIKSNVVNTSLESQLLSTLYNYGLIGLGVSVFWLVILFSQFRRLPKNWRIIGYLLLFNVIGVSLISDLFFHYSSFVFVTLLYVYIRSKTKDSDNLDSPDRGV